jgi:hypothetical protein
VGSLLALAAAAVLAGARSFAAIGEWIADVPQHVLANIAQGLRHMARNTSRPLTLLGIST